MQTRPLALVNRHDAEGFGGRTRIGECTEMYPVGIPLDMISRINADVPSAPGGPGA